MQPDWLPEWLSYILLWMHQEQSIVAGVIALFAALITVHAMGKQLDFQREQLEDEKRRKLRAQRAYLPHALSELVDYCNKCFLLSRAGFIEFERYKSGENTLKLPAIPRDAIHNLNKMLEQSLDEPVISAIEGIIRDLQTTETRLSASFNAIALSPEISGINSKNTFPRRAYEMHILRRRIENLFDFARGESEAPLCLRKIETELKSYFFSKSETSEFDREFEKYFRSQWLSEGEAENTALV